MTESSTILRSPRKKVPGLFSKPSLVLPASLEERISRSPVRTLLTEKIAPAPSWSEDRLAVATYVADKTGSLDDLRARVEEVHRLLLGAV